MLLQDLINLRRTTVCFQWI